jgi:hypothetical protein
MCLSFLIERISRCIDHSTLFAEMGVLWAAWCDKDAGTQEPAFDAAGLSSVMYVYRLSEGDSTV